MQRYRVFRLIAAFVLVALPASARTRARVDDINSAISTVTAGNNEFALELYAQLRDDPEALGQDGNMFFSPYSISTALAMTYAGAGGETAKQMAEVLHFSLPSEKLHGAFGRLEKQLNAAGKKDDYQLHVANALWGQKDYKFLGEFLKVTKDNYGAGLEEVDFRRETEKARVKINTWVEKQTKDKIKNLIPRGVLGSLTRLVLTNAIYFKGDWKSKFEEKDTKDMPFHVTKEKTKQVPMMYQKGDFRYAENDDLQVLELPYKGDDLSMIVLLPKKVDGLKKQEQSLTGENLNKWLERLHEQEVHVYLPKFKITWGVYDLKKVLRKMGMKDAFSQLRADFSPMTGAKDLYISNILHKAFVAVDEEGSEAAAATAVIMTRTGSSGRHIPTFRADHPFVFMIRDNRSDSILFMGRVTNPAQAAVSRVEANTLPQDKNGNFVLTVSNQSFAIDPVDIKIYIDGKLALDQEFDVGTGIRRQHNWQMFQFQLPDGIHKFRAESIRGQVSLEKQFEIKGKRWAVLDYWFYPDTHDEPIAKHFSFGVSDKRLGAGD